MATPALVSAAALATTAYLNAKLGIKNDLRQLSYDREWLIRFQQWLGTLGDRCTLHHIFELADGEAEAVWFEGRTWTYGELKNSEYFKQRFLNENS